MKNALIIAFLIFTTIASATDYYISSSGNDSNNGLSPSTPWKTIAKVNASSYLPGDNIFFNKGDSWREQLNISSSGSIRYPIVFNSYGTGNDPIITGANIVAGFSYGGGNIWDAAVTTEPNVVLKSKTLQTKVANRAAVKSEGNWYWTGNVLSVYATSDPSGLVEAGYRTRVMDTRSKSYLTFNGITFECSNSNNSSMIYTSHTTENQVKFYNCTMQYSAYTGIRFGGDADNVTVGCVMDGCIIRYNFGDGIYSQHDGDVTINNCQVYSNGLDPVVAYNGIKGCLGNYKITHCDVYDNGRGLTDGPPHGIYQYLSSGVLYVTNCTVHDQPFGSGIRLRGSGTVTNCALYGNAHAGVNMDSNDTYNVIYTLVSNLIYNNGVNGIIRGGKGTGTVNIIGYNNTILHNTGSGSAFCVAFAVKNLTWKNNIIYTVSQYCFENNSTAPVTSDIDYNIYYRSDNNGYSFRWINTFKTFAQWQALGLDVHGIYDNPDLVDITAPTYDLHLQPDSPANNAGINVGLTLDNEGNIIGNPPDIGALETQPATSTTIPVYTSSVVENATPARLEMTYNLSLANIVPAASSFTVRVNSVARTINSVSISGTKALLILASAVVNGDVVTIAYTKPATNPLQTASVGIAANISNQSVINNCINVSPTTVITSPINNSSFTALANITITANALDNDGSISIVEFYNGSTKLGSKSTAPYSFTWNNVVVGTYSLSVIATDNQNAKTRSLAISISVNNGTPSVNQPPVITISNPNKGNKYKSPATITIDAIASDPDGTISKVEFYSGLIKLVELTSAPYSYTWKDVEAGSYSITAIATDNLNANTTSSPIEFEVGANIKYDADSKIINLYPNPNDGRFSIEFINPLQNEKGEVVITDLTGKQVYNGPLSKEETIKQFDLSYIKSGFYILMIIYKEILVTKKFIKY